jgi:two-component system, OmpR family, response regulator ChvI
MTAAFDQVATGLDAGESVLLGSVNEPDAIRVFLIRDSAMDCGFLANKLSAQGFAVQTVASLAAAPGAVGDADVIVMHCDWTKMSSLELLDKLQRQTLGVPIVLLTGEASPAREDGAIDKPSIDVVGKSRDSEVLARRLKRAVEAFGRRSQMRAGGIVCGKLLLRPDISRACWKGADVGLTLGEYNIVHLLASNVGRYVTYRAIYDRLHYEGFIAGDGADGYRANVRSAIKRIRNKFRACDPTFDEIENYNGFGYCWKKPD